MDEVKLKKRIEDSINKIIPEICGSGCPVICCTPVITGNFIPKNLLEKDNFEKAESYITQSL